MVQAENDSISSPNKMMVNMIVLRKTISDVLSLLLSTNDEAVIDKALLHILHFFDVDRVYIGIFDEQSSIVDFTHEVTSEGIISMREDLLRQLSKDDIPWWIEQIKAGKDIIIYDTAKMPPWLRRPNNICWNFKTSSRFWSFRFRAKERCTVLSAWTLSRNIRTGTPSISKTCGYWPISYP